MNDGILKNTTTSMIANEVTLQFVQNMITSQPVGFPMWTPSSSGLKHQGSIAYFRDDSVILCIYIFIFIYLFIYGPFHLLCVQGFSKEEGSTWTNHTPESYPRIIPRPKIGHTIELSICFSSL